MKLPKFAVLAALAIASSVGFAVQATVLTYQAALSGPNESPANASPGTGIAQAIYDDQAHTLALSVNFSGLTGTTSASHIHAPTAVALTGTAGVEIGRAHV